MKRSRWFSLHSELNWQKLYKGYLHLKIERGKLNRPTAWVAQDVAKCNKARHDILKFPHCARVVPMRDQFYHNPCKRTSRRTGTSWKMMTAWERIILLHTFKSKMCNDGSNRATPIASKVWTVIPRRMCPQRGDSARSRPNDRWDWMCSSGSLIHKEIKWHPVCSGCRPIYMSFFGQGNFPHKWGLRSTIVCFSKTDVRQKMRWPALDRCNICAHSKMRNQSSGGRCHITKRKELWTWANSSNASMLSKCVTAIDKSVVVLNVLK